MEWQPFSTAPKDRTIFAAYWGTIPYIVMWNEKLGWYHVRDCQPVKRDFDAWAEMSTPNQYDVEHNAEPS